MAFNPSRDVGVASRIEIIQGTSPPKGSVIIVSTDANGTPGGLKSRILGPLGLDDESMPTAEALHRGYAILRRPDFPGVVGFVVTVGDGDVTEAIIRNLHACLTDSQIERQSDIWIPLIGTGAGRLKMAQSMKAILQALKESHFLDKESARVSIAVPKEISLSEFKSLQNLLTKLLVAEGESTSGLLERRFLSPAFLPVLDLAAYLSAGKKTQRGQITTSTLLFALLEARNLPALFDNPDPLLHFWNAVSTLAVKEPVAVMTAYFRKDFDFSGARELPRPERYSLSPRATSILEVAGSSENDLARPAPTLEDLIIAMLDAKRGRHLDALKSMGISVHALKEQFLIRSKRAAAITAEYDAPPILPSAEGAILQNYVAGVWNDTADANASDFLDIGHEVKAFAQLIASRSTRPPLSIGIFGEWGSGKSFFMESLQQQVTAISQASEKNEAGAFHTDIVPIRFNAWHYIETNLWASLVEHIFRELDAWLRKDSAKNSEKLFEQLTTSKQLRFEAARDLIERLTAKKLAEEKLKEAQRKQADAVSGKLSITDAGLWTAAIDIFRQALSPEDLKKASELKQELGIGQLETDTAALAQLVSDSRTQAGRARVLVTSCITKLSTGWMAFWLATLIVLVPLAIELGRHMLAAIFPGSLFSELRTQMFALASVLATIVFYGRIVLGYGASALKTLDSFNKKLSDAVFTATKAQHDSLLEAEKELAAASQSVTVAEQQLIDATALASKAEQDFGNETARGRLNRFIRDKVSDGVYARHLSLIATIRKDFSQLTEIMTGDGDASVDAKELERAHLVYLSKVSELLKANPGVLSKEIEATLTQAVENAELRYFSRIVLYIDDLDRCPAEKVAEVLQAIHLLLFFRLFVVVVAVDAKWMARSLEQQFPDLLARPTGTGNLPASESGSSVSLATALDYIEKIFQIPFWVQPMTPDLGEAFIGNLTATRTADSVISGSVYEPIPAGDAPEKPENVAQPEVPQPLSKPSDDGSETDQEAVPSGYAGAQSAGTEGALSQEEYLLMAFSPQEIRILKSFARFIASSPRRAKRNLNVYQVLKTGLVQSAKDNRLQLSDLVCPVIATTLALLDGPRDTENAFFAALRTEKNVAGVISILRDSATSSETIAVLQHLVEICKREKMPTGSQLIEELKRLAPIVRRYSFDCRL